jgi:hypothetical protein
MRDWPTRQRLLALILASAAVLVLGTALAGGYFYFSWPAPNEVHVAPGLPPRSYLNRVKIEYFCSRCHAYPPPEVFPRSVWKQEVEQAYQFFAESSLSMQAPPIGDAIRYYEEGAPLELPHPVIAKASNALPVKFTAVAQPAVPEVPEPAISNVNLVHLFDERRLDVLACDMRAGLVMALSPYRPAPSWRVLAKVSHPAHAEVVDLDGDCIKDILVANLGPGCSRLRLAQDGRDHLPGKPNYRLVAPCLRPPRIG